MSDQFLKHLHDLLQSESDRVCNLYGLPFLLQIGDVRSDDGRFQSEVIVKKTREAELPISSELVRSLLSTIEQNVEEKYQGLRLMLMASSRPRVKKSAARRKAS